MDFGLRPYVAVLALILLSAHVTALTVMDMEKHQEVNTTPIAIVDSSILSGNIIRCARVHVSGLSRLKHGSYSSTHRAAVVPSPNIQEKSYKRIQICLHNNASLGLCRCENDNWESIQNGMWGSNMSPYGDKYIDVKFVDNLSGSVTVSIKEEFRRWRVLCLFIGMVLLLLAPVVSGWVPFYYSSSMAIGICLVILIVLFQGMKLLPTGRKTALYSTMYGLAIGAGSFLLKRFSTFVNSILVNFGISEEMHNPTLEMLEKKEILLVKKALEEVGKAMKFFSDVDKTMNEINEQTENMKQISDALSQLIGPPLADFDEDELEAELEELEGAELEEQRGHDRA